MRVAIVELLAAVLWQKAIGSACVRLFATARVIRLELVQAELEKELHGCVLCGSARLERQFELCEVCRFEPAQ